MTMMTLGWFMMTAMANGPVLERGICSDGSLWTMEARDVPRNRVEVEFALESFVAGETWDIEVWRDGRQLATLVRTTRGADGDLWVEGELRDRAGVEFFEVFATNRVTGEVCEGTVEWPH
jgi:hypothetical protein